MAIRWHMGGFDDAARGGSFAISEAYDKYPLAVKLHIADLEATYLIGAPHQRGKISIKKDRCTVVRTNASVFFFFVKSPSAVPAGR